MWKVDVITMINFKLDLEKTLNSALFILERLGGRSDFHKLFKVLYFADQKHLATYGMPITGDLYVAMKNGPVPSELYDVFKSVRDFPAHAGDNPNLFAVTNGYNIAAKRNPDIDTLSESNIECLIEAIDENRQLNFNQLTLKSHNTAWEAASNDEMSVIEIAREGGANDEMLKYIELNLENQIIFSNYATSW